MLQKEMQASDELFDEANNLDDWANKIVTLSLSMAIAGLVAIGLIINFFFV